MISLKKKLLMAAGPKVRVMGVARGSGSSILLPSHEVGDFILVRTRRASTASIETPPGYTEIFSAVADGIMKGGYRLAASNNESSGVWSGATEILALVVRGVKSIGNSNVYTDPVAGTSSQTPNLPGQGARYIFLMNTSTITSSLSMMSSIPGSNGLAAITERAVTDFPPQSFNQVNSARRVGIFEMKTV